MLQHDIRLHPSGAACVERIRPLLTANCVFTELETSLVRPGRQPEKKRNSVFFHAASPCVVDVLVDMGFNLFATANNHAGDLGEEGIRTLMEEFAMRELVMGGIGMNARHAALPVFLDTPHGRIAQVAFASKIPAHSIATIDSPGVNSLSMADVDTSTLNEEELDRVLQSIEQARAGYVDPDTDEHVAPADLVIAYHHNVRDGFLLLRACTAVRDVFSCIFDLSVIFTFDSCFVVPTLFSLFSVCVCFSALLGEECDGEYREQDGHLEARFGPYAHRRRCARVRGAR